MENVVGCDIIEEKSNGKCVFRIIYFSQNAHDFKHYDFETESDKAGENLVVTVLYSPQSSHIVGLKLSLVDIFYNQILFQALCLLTSTFSSLWSTNFLS